MKTLIITDSWDITADIIVDRIGHDVFRLNTDLFSQYLISITGPSLEISDPTGRSISEKEIGSVYWRKPFTAEGFFNPSPSEAFYYAEVRYVVREIYNLLTQAGKYAMVEEGAERRLGKLVQLTKAIKYFEVPDWQVLSGKPWLAAPCTVVKSLSGSPVDADSVLYTRRVDNLSLTEDHPWLIQQFIDKGADLTVCFIEGACFAFERTADSCVTDWRIEIGQDNTSAWRPKSISKVLVLAINEFMQECRLRYGRLDFALSQGREYFLEVNPNGQWAWLDPEDACGLISTMTTAVQGLLT